MNATNAGNVAIVGLGKMGVSHLAIANAIPQVQVTSVCDSSALLGQMVEKYCGISFVGDYDELIRRPGLTGVIIATPTRFHDKMVRDALERGLNVFCEKPMTLSAEASAELGQEAHRRGLVGQVGYHNRFVGTFREAKRLLDGGAIGRIRHVHAEAYGPVVLRPAAKTWRSQSNEGGGCLYDYAAHPINLMNWYVGAPVECIGAELQHQYSEDVEDAVYANLRMANGVTGQVSVNWSDETVRKMTTRISIWGDGGKIVADRQELQVYLGATAPKVDGYDPGWTVRYTTDLTGPVSYYLRGEEYSAQLEGFGTAIAAGAGATVSNDFASAADTDLTLQMIRRRAAAEPPPLAAIATLEKSRSFFARVRGR